SCAVWPPSCRAAWRKPSLRLSWTSCLPWCSLQDYSGSAPAWRTCLRPQKRLQARRHFLRRPFRQVVAAGERLALVADVAGALAPGRGHVEEPAHRSVLGPQHQQGTRDLLALVFLVVLQVNGRRGAVVFAGGVNGARDAEGPEVFLRRRRL